MAGEEDEGPVAMEEQEGEEHDDGVDEAKMDDDGDDPSTTIPPFEPAEGLTFQCIYGANETEPMCYLLKVRKAPWL